MRLWLSLSSDLGVLVGEAEMGAKSTAMNPLGTGDSPWKDLAQRFKFQNPSPSMMTRTAHPLSDEEHELLEAGATLFDAGKFWHAHEAWEDLWNDLKRRRASDHEILLVQGMIQTAALLLHHQRKNIGGVEKQWAKLTPKLEGWSVAWGFDIERHLETIGTYVLDNGTWALTAAHHQLPRA